MKPESIDNREVQLERSSAANWISLSVFCYINPLAALVGDLEKNASWISLLQYSLWLNIDNNQVKGLFKKCCKHSKSWTQDKLRLLSYLVLYSTFRVFTVTTVTHALVGNWPKWFTANLLHWLWFDLTILCNLSPMPESVEIWPEFDQIYNNK